MSDELPGGKSLDFIFQTIAENNDEKATEAAREIINTANDREMRNEIVKLVNNYQKAEDSIQMHDAMEALVEYCKKQYSLILIQGFRFGQGYQQKISNELFKEVLKKASTPDLEKQEVEQEIKDTEAKEDTKS